MGRKTAEYKAMLFDPEWHEKTHFWMEPRPGKRPSDVDIIKRELAEAQSAEIVKDRAAFEIETGMNDDDYIDSVAQTFYAPTPAEAAALAEELTEQRLRIAELEGMEAVAELCRAA